MLGRSLVAFALGASVLAVATAADAGRNGPQVTVYLGGYGQPTGSPQPQPTSSAQPLAPNANLALQAEVTIAQLAAYNRYLQYVALANSQSRGGSLDATQYFTNGAAATTVPTAGQPGSGYFTNGAEVTPAPAPTPAPPPTSAQPPSAPLAPFWWVEGETPPSPPPPPPPAQAAAPAPEAALDDTRPLTAMSFEEWLQSMGADVQEATLPDPAPSDGEETAPLMEPSAAVLEVRRRMPPAVREKTREHFVAPGSSNGPIAAMIGTFAAGLLLGALAMKRPVRHFTR